MTMAHNTMAPNRRKPLRFARGDNLRTAVVENVECEDLADLLIYLRSHRTEKKGGAYITTSAMAGTRRTQNAHPTRLIGLDYDKLSPGQDMALVTRLRELGMSAVYWMTHSHTPEAPRMRILVEVDREVTWKQYRAAWRQVTAALGAQYVPDKSTSHCDQPLFLPGTSALVVRMPGRPFQLGETPDIETEPSPAALDLERPPERLSREDAKVLKYSSVKAILDRRDSYDSLSDFDFALFTELARIAGKNPNRVWRIAFHSGARREKWERQDYVARTINAAINSLGGPRDVDWDQFGQSLAQVQAKPPAPTAWILPGLLARGASSFIVGRPKGGKSTLALQMGLAAAGRTEIWTSWETLGFSPPPKPMNVLYMDLEQSDSLAYQSVARLRLAGDWPTNFWRINQVPVLDEAGLETLERLIDRLRMDLVIIDTWLRVDPSDLMEGRNVFAKQGAAVQRVTEMAHRKNLHISMLVHAGKRSDPGDPSLQVAGTSAMTASVDDIIVVSYAGSPQDEEDGGDAASRRIITTMGRNYSTSGSRFVVERREGRLEMLGDEHQVTRNLNQQAILDALADGGEMTTAEIADQIGRPRPGTSRSLYQLERSGRVERLGRRGWRLAR